MNKVILYAVDYHVGTTVYRRFFRKYRNAELFAKKSKENAVVHLHKMMIETALNVLTRQEIYGDYIVKAGWSWEQK